MAEGNIPQFTSPVDSLHPSETGVEAVTRAAALANRQFTETGAAVEQTGRQAGHDIGSGIAAAGEAAVAQLDHQQISHGAAAEAAMLDTLGQTWDDTVKNAAKNNPNDTTVATNFKQNVLEPTLDTFANSFTTKNSQDWAEKRVEALRDHFTTKTAVDMGDLAADAASTNLKTLSNSWTNTAVRDPGSVPFLLATAKDHVDAIVSSSPNLRGVQAAKVTTDLFQKAQEGIVKSGMIGAMQKSSDPVATAQAWIAKYPNLIDGAEALQAGKIAQSIDRTNLATAKTIESLQRQKQKDDFNAKAAHLAASVIQPDGSRQPPADYFKQVQDLGLHHPGATVGEINALVEHGQPKATEIGTDPETKSALQDKLIAGTLQPMDLVVAANDKTGHGIQEKDYTALENQRKLLEEHPLNDKGFEAAKDAMKSTMVLPGAYSDALQEFLPAYLKLDPKDKAAALNFSDPNSLISKTMAPHMPSQSEKMQYQMFKNAGIGMTPQVPHPELDGVPAGLRQYVGRGLAKSNDGKTFWYNGTTYDQNGNAVKGK